MNPSKSDPRAACENAQDLEGGPEFLEIQINKILGSKHKDRFLDLFFGSGTKYLSGSFFVPASPLQVL